MKTTTWSSLIAHKHCIRVEFKGRSMRICARCTGLIIGFISSLGLTLLFNLGFFLHLSLPSQITICILFAVPAILDWTTQCWRLRSSTNSVRIVTGFSEGIGIALLTLVAMPISYKFFTIFLVAVLTINFGLLGQRFAQTLNSSIPSM